MTIYTTSSSASGTRITASGSNSGHTILEGVALESTNGNVITFSGGDGSLTVGGYAIGSGGYYAVSVLDGAQDIIVNILESGHMFGGGILQVSSAELVRVNFINAGNVYANDIGYNGSSGVDKIINSGFIGVSDGNAINTRTGKDEVYNSGTIQGNVLLGNDNDLYDGRGGTVIGEVQGGLGDDTYIVDDATVALIEFADQGTDLVKSTVNFKLAENFENLSMIGSDDVRGTGNGESNEISGNSGDNVLRGLGGVDTLSGASGNDTLRGGKGNDKLNGGTGDDTLRGGAGKDKLIGSDGNDILIGGAGKDTLSGGDGSDQFVFSRAPHSPNTSDADTVTDFELGIDRIDLSGLVAGNIDFIGSAGFSGTGPEARATTNGGSTIVRVDVDGDGAADMKVILDGVTGVLESDFIF